MKIEFHGAARTVTGSQHIVNVNGYRILLDCGLYQGKRAVAMARNRNLPFDPASIDLMILSHAHIDHCGNIPNLVKNGFRGDIICTYATRDLCAIMLRDSAKIQEYDIAYVNKKRAKQGLPPVEPYYTSADAIESLKYFIGLGYDRTRTILPGIALTFYDAGHILGSAMVALDIEDEEQKRDIRLVFSGDIGRAQRPILRDPTFLDEADVLIMESTYGNRDHPPYVAIDDSLSEIVNETCRRHGRLIIPAFAVGRTQEIVYRLHRLYEANRIAQDIPVFVDSPMAIDATGVYRLHPEAYDDEVAEFILTDRHKDLFGFDQVRYTRSVSESKELNNLRDAAVIISASGMAEAGRILHHLKNNIENPDTTILIVGWQAPHTLGRRLVEKVSKVRIFGEEYQLRAQVKTLNGLSGHADRGELLKWATHFRRRPKHTFLVHGEEASGMALAEELRSVGFENVMVPDLGDAVEI